MTDADDLSEGRYAREEGIGFKLARYLREGGSDSRVLHVRASRSLAREGHAHRNRPCKSNFETPPLKETSTGWYM